MRLAISLISMRDRESECVAEMRGVEGSMVGAGVVSTLLTRGDLRGLSMLRPTKLHSGILNMCLHADSPGRKKGEQDAKRREQWVKSERRKEASDRTGHETRDKKSKDENRTSEKGHV